MVSINSNSDSLKKMGEDWKPSPELFDNMMNAVCLLSQEEKDIYRGVFMLLLSCVDENGLSPARVGAMYARLSNQQEEKGTV